MPTFKYKYTHKHTCRQKREARAEYINIHELCMNFVHLFICVVRRIRHGRAWFGWNLITHFIIILIKISNMYGVYICIHVVGAMNIRDSIRSILNMMWQYLHWWCTNWMIPIQNHLDDELNAQCEIYYVNTGKLLAFHHSIPHLPNRLLV